jgi:hypothetical protein
MVLKYMVADVGVLEIITISDANIVGTNGLKAGVQVWQNKIKHRLSNVKT